MYLGNAKYRLSHFLRGRKGTDHAISGHGIDEDVALLSLPDLASLDVSLDQLNKTYLYKTVSYRQVLSDVDDVPSVYKGYLFHTEFYWPF